MKFNNQIHLFVYCALYLNAGLILIFFMVSPMYIAEIAPPSKRDSLVFCPQFAIILGMLIVDFGNYGIALLGNDEWLYTVGWRYMFACCAILTTIKINDGLNN